MLEPTPKTLRNAADYLRKHGWCRRSIGTPDGPACLVGAYLFGNNRTEGSLSLSWQETDALRDALGLGGFDTAVSWNDYEARGKREVIRRLEYAACRLEKRETI